MGSKPAPDFDLKDWVLSKFAKEDLKALESAFDRAYLALELMVNSKFDEAMSKYNG